MHRTPEYWKRRRLEDEKAAAAGPVVLTYFRKHKDWFLPVGMTSLNEMSISSPSHFVRSLGQMKEPPERDSGFVLAAFVHDRGAPPQQVRWRTIVFQIRGGKIDPDCIQLDGFGSRESTLTEVLKE